jgi:putative NADH-flavin reductase
VTIAIFGANGATGRLLVSQALDAGHEIVAVTRNPASFPFRRSGLRIVGADVHDAALVSDAITGCEAVLSTLGARMSP